MLNNKKQTGSSAWSTLILVLALIFIAVTIMKLWAPYYDDLAVKTALKNVADETETRAMSPKEIRQTINKRLQVNQVNLNAEDIHIKKEDGEVNIDIIYERRVPMYGNVDAMVKFQHSAKFNAKK